MFTGTVGCVAPGAHRYWLGHRLEEETCRPHRDNPSCWIGWTGFHCSWKWIADCSILARFVHGPWVQQECGAVPTMRRDDAAAVFSTTSRLRVFFVCISAAQDSEAVRRRDPAPSTRKGSLLRPLLVMAAGFVLASHCAAACPISVSCVFLRNEPPFWRSVCVWGCLMGIHKHRRLKNTPQPKTPDARALPRRIPHPACAAGGLLCVLVAEVAVPALGLCARALGRHCKAQTTQKHAPTKFA